MDDDIKIAILNTSSFEDDEQIFEGDEEADEDDYSEDDED